MPWRLSFVPICGLPFLAAMSKDYLLKPTPTHDHHLVPSSSTSSQLRQTWKSTSGARRPLSILAACVLSSDQNADYTSSSDRRPCVQNETYSGQTSSDQAHDEST